MYLVSASYGCLISDMCALIPITRIYANPCHLRYVHADSSHPRHTASCHLSIWQMPIPLSSDMCLSSPATSDICMPIPVTLEYVFADSCRLRHYHCLGLLSTLGCAAILDMSIAISFNITLTLMAITSYQCLETCVCVLCVCVCVCVTRVC